MKNIQLICKTCSKSFERSLSQYTYQSKKGRESFCSKSCGTTHNNTQYPKLRTPNAYDISNHASNKRDEFTGFREFITRIKKRAKSNAKFDCKITLQELKSVWDSQKGICPYTGLALELPTTLKSLEHNLAKASLDRIDSLKGYTVDNVQFISVYINYMKSNLPQSDFKILLQLIKERV